MNAGRTIFSQIMEFLPAYEFRQCVEKYQGNYKVKSFSCWDQFLSMAFAQLTYRESLRDIQTWLRAAKQKTYHMGIRGKISRNTLAHANQVRDWRIYADFAQVLIKQARELYAGDSFGMELDQTIYALDATTIDLCLSLFSWATFRKRKGAVKLNTLLDLRGDIPTIAFITNGKVHEVNVLDKIPIEAGAIYIMDRGYLELRTSLQSSSISGIFCDQNQKQFQFPAALFANGKQVNRTAMRPDRYSPWLLLQERLSGKTPANSLLRCHAKKEISLLDQQFYSACVSSHRVLSQALANRVVLQVDQAASADKSILWNFRKCGKNSDMDCHLRICAGSYNQKVIEVEAEPLHNSTGFEHNPFRENATFTSAYGCRCQTTICRN